MSDQKPPHFSDHFSSASDRYRTFRPQYPAELFSYLADISPATNHAWDCGCGNGQASVVLANHFAQVTATDASAAQIAEAMPASNVNYCVAPAESISAADESLDLITVAQAIHWFDHGKFFAEVERSLKPGGVLAAWGYQLLYSNTALDAVIEHFHSDVVGAYWPKGRELLDNGYTKIPFCFPRETTPEFFMRIEWQFEHLLGYLNTWSAVKAYEQAKGSNPVENCRDVLLSAWGDAQQSKAIFWPLILYVGKKG